jgi:hypothetical protein
MGMDGLDRDVDFLRSFAVGRHVSTKVNGRIATDYVDRGEILVGQLSSVTPREMVAYASLQKRVTHELVVMDDDGTLPVAAERDRLTLVDTGRDFYVQQVAHPGDVPWAALYTLEERGDLG